MATVLMNYTNNRDNNFNLLRFIAATLVLFSHSFALATGSGDAEPMRFSLGITLAYIAVDVFFITSGFLICGSFINKRSLISFIWARILRIYPALIVAMFVCTFVIGTFFSNLTLWEYLNQEHIYKFFIKNSSLLFGVSDQLPGVFENNPFKDAINGSLWTLPYELKMYIMLAATLSITVYIGKWLSWITIKRCLLLGTVISVSLHIINHIDPFYTGSFFKSFIRLSSLFFYGATYYAWRDKLKLSSATFTVMLVLLLLSSIHKDFFFVCYSLLLPYIIFYVAYVPKGNVRMFNKLGDYSYGIYIYAWPIQQSITSISPGISVYALIIYSFLVSLILAILSWHLIERYALNLKGKSIIIERKITLFKSTLTRKASKP